MMDPWSPFKFVLCLAICLPLFGWLLHAALKRKLERKPKGWFARYMRWYATSYPGSPAIFAVIWVVLLTVWVILGSRSFANGEIEWGIQIVAMSFLFTTSLVFMLLAWRNQPSLS